METSSSKMGKATRNFLLLQATVKYKINTMYHKTYTHLDLIQRK